MIPAQSERKVNDWRAAWREAWHELRRGIGTRVLELAFDIFPDDSPEKMRLALWVAENFPILEQPKDAL